MEEQLRDIIICAFGEQNWGDKDEDSNFCFYYKLFFIT